jgi:raffinose/stachyose/melibiose transport system substrate-binding protein
MTRPRTRVLDGSRSGHSTTSATARRSHVRWRGRLAGAVVATAALLVVSACSSSGSGGSSGGGSSSGSTVKSLTMWGPPGEFSVPGFTAMVQGFEKESGITINLQTIPLPFETTVLAKFQAGTRPDLLIWHGIGNWVAALNPNQNLVSLNGMSFIKKTIPNILNHSVTYNNNVYSAIIGFPIIDGMMYNKQVFAKYGVSVPTNLAGVEAACQQLKQKAPNVAPIYIAGSGTDDWTDQILPFIMFNDAVKQDPGLMEKVNENKLHFSDPVFVAGFQAVKDLQNQGCINKDVLSATYVGQQKALMTGTTAMIFQLSQIFPTLVDSYGLAKVNQTVGFQCVSKTTGVCSWQTPASADPLFVPKSDPAHEAAAKQFIDYATGPGYGALVHASGSYPMLQGYDSDVNTSAIPLPMQTAHNEWLANTVPQYQQDLLANYGPIEADLQDMLAGKSTPLQVGQKLQSDFAQNAQLVGLPGF